MELNTILENLCFHDERNPDKVSGAKEQNCSCDNCFYGTTELAEEILRLRKLLGYVK